MAHEELKAQYEIDRQHSDNPGQYWEFKTCYGHWIDAYTPGFFDSVEYRRKPDAPVWYPIGRHPAESMAEDARKWRELVELASESGGISFEKFKEIRGGKKVEELIQGYTEDQWQTISDGKFLCEFSDDGWNEDDSVRISVLFGLCTERLPFYSGLGSTWKYCRPLRAKGVRQPWFGGECPVNPGSKVLVTFRDGGQSDPHGAGGLFWGHDQSPSDIVEFIEL